MFKDYDSFKNAVAKEALKQSKYKAICTDGLKEYFKKQDFDGGVQHAIMETMFWEGDFLPMNWKG
jgi:hypothetical protein